MAQDARVVVKHLGEDIAPEPAQPLAVGEHGDSVAGGLISRLERLRLHISNGIDRMRRRTSGNADRPAATAGLPWECVTVETWQEFLDHGGDVTGFREKRWKTVQKIKLGDHLLCYLTGASRWVGLLEVTSEPVYDEAPIWTVAAHAYIALELGKRPMVVLHMRPTWRGQVPFLRSASSISRIGSGSPRMIAAEASTLRTESRCCQASVNPAQRASCPKKARCARPLPSRNGCRALTSPR